MGFRQEFAVNLRGMPLKVRFRHGSNQRVLDLPDRGADMPLIIGRSTDVDLRLPFDSIAARHAALFLKDGVWVIQALSGVVTLAGKPLGGPAKLRRGDILALGADATAATLEIEPNVASTAPSPANPARPQPAPAPAPGIRPSQPTPEPMTGDVSSAETGDTIEWDPQVSMQEVTQFYVPKARTPWMGILVAVILGGGLIGTVGYYAYQKARQPSVIVLGQSSNQPPATPVSTAPKKKPLFDLNQDQQPERNSQNAGAATPASSGHPSAQPKSGAGDSSVASADRTDPRVQPSDDASSTAASPPAKEQTPPDPNDAEWNEIRSAHYNVRHQGVAILKFDEYRLEHPGKFTDLLDRYTDEAVNWLYWQRVAQLWSRRDDQTAELRQKSRDVQNQPAGEFHDKLVREKAELQGKVDQTNQLLTDEMGYSGDVPPDLESPRALKQLEASRDPAKFAAFSKRVLRYVRNNHGGVWWDGE